MHTKDPTHTKNHNAYETAIVPLRLPPRTSNYAQKQFDQKPNGRPIRAVPPMPPL